MNARNSYYTMVIVALLFLSFLFTSSVAIDSNPGRNLLQEENLSRFQQACIDFDLTQIEETSRDCSSEGQPVTVSGDPKPKKGKYGNAVAFDGVDDNFTSSVEYESGSFTEAIWIYSTNSSWGRSTIDWPGRWVTKHKNLNGGFFVLDRSDGPVAGYRMVTFEGEKIIVLPIEVTTSRWVHITAVYNNQSQELKIYRNGRIVETTQLKSPPRSWNGQIFGGKGSYWFAGYLDNYRMYNTSLTDKQVEAVYRGKTSFLPLLYSIVLDLMFIFFCVLLGVGAVYYHKRRGNSARS